MTMRRFQCLLLVLLALAYTAGAKADPKYAGTAMPLSGVSILKIDALESEPVQFVLHAKVEMPTPGWELKVDRVTCDEKTGIVRADLTGKGPRGMVAQVITPTPVKIKLGRLVKGRPLVDLHVRLAPNRRYERVGALALLAR